MPLLPSAMSTRGRWRALAGALAVCMALLAPPPAAQAATRDYYFEQIGSDRGLVQNSVTAMLQDSQGFIWVATQGGLHRYDGHRYIPYRHDPGDPTSLPDSYVTAMALDGQSLWVGSYSEYIARLDLHSGRIRRYAPAGDLPQARRHVMALLPEGKTLWVGTAAGLERFDTVTGQRELVLALPSPPAPAQPGQQLLAATDGGLWYATSAGLFHIDDGGRSSRLGDAVPTRGLLRDRGGQLWVGRSDGLFRLQPSADGGMLVRAWPAGDPVRGIDVRALVESPDRHLWLSVAGGGLLRFDPATGKSHPVRQATGVRAGLPEDSITSLLVDRGGMLWIGGQYRGVAVTDPRGTPFRYVFDLIEGEHDRTAPADSVRAVLESKPGVLWVATDSARLLRYSMGPERIEDWTGRLPPVPSDAAPLRILAMAPAEADRLWLATSHGLLRMDPGTGVVEAIELGAYSDVFVRTVLVARDGSLWLGTAANGALHYRPRTGALTHYGHADGRADRLPHPSVHALLQDRRGRVWIGTSAGLTLLDPGSGRMRHYSHRPASSDGLSGHFVRALHEGADGTVWIGTHTGLSEVVEAPDGGISFRRSLAAALGGGSMPAIFSIGESAGGRLWLGTDTGIVAFDPHLARARFYGMADGLQDLEFNGGAATALADGRLVFGGVRGLNVFDPARMVDSDYTAPVRLLAARIGAGAQVDDGALWQPQALRLDDAADILRLRIGALDYAPNADTRYRYRLDGFDPGWIHNGHQSEITYTQLPPGRYVFRAQASNRDGVWSGSELRIPLHVAPPWWRSPLMVALSALAAVVLLAVVVWRWLRQRRIEQGWYTRLREREERLQLALWASGEQFWDYDLGGRELHRMRVDDHSSDTPDIGVHTDIDENHEIHPDDLPGVRDLLRQHLRGQAALFLSEHRVRRADGQWSWVRARGRVVERDATGKAVRVAGTARDITASRSAERDRRISSEVLRSMAEAVAVFDRDFVFVSVNPAFTRMTGYADREVIGRSTGLLDSLQHDPEFYQRMRGQLQRDGHWSGEVWQQRKDGNEFLCSLQASAVHDARTERLHYVAVLSDITDQKRAEQELRYLANYDPLTSLPNRTLLSERLSRAIVRARRANRNIAVLFLDLDRFKDINDSLGHAAGDRILRAAAARLQETVGMQHTVARLGGDEFTVVLEHIDGAGQAEDVARQIITAFEAPLEIDERHDIAISPSIGISLYPEHAQVPTDLIKHADTAMYQAKQLGRRTFMRYNDTMDVDQRRRATISAALRKVLDRDELRLVFQPRLSLASGGIVGVEALLRWDSPEHGEIGPAQFIPLAEENGLILDIGEWALRQACMRLQEWRRQGLENLTMAVNVSALQLLRGDLPRVVSRVLADTGIPAGRLELELTESVIMGNAEQTGATLQAFRELGVGLAIDDFGTGYSSLAYLKRLPITTLKIDKEFIDDLTLDPDDEAITSTVIAMAHSLGLNVIAEGVETLAQMQFLREHHCDEIQGYWLARPLPPEACLRFLNAWGREPVVEDA